MIIGEIIELVYIKATGGRLGTDTNTYRADIRALLPAAINTAAKDSKLLNIKLGINEQTNPDLFYSTFEDVVVKYKNSRELKYIELPAAPFYLFGNDEFIFIRPMVGDEEMYYMKNRTQDVGYEDTMGKTTRYWLEKNIAYFKNISPSVNSVLVQMVVSINDLNDNDEAPIPAGFEYMVIENLEKFFIAQKFNVNDDLINNIEDIPNK